MAVEETVLLLGLSLRQGGGEDRACGGSLVYHLVRVDGGLHDALGEVLLHALGDGDGSFAVDDGLDFCANRA
jgi:hypothetical protein